MKNIIISLVFLGLTSSISVDSTFSFEKKELLSCPSSPNCISTQESRKRKRMRPIKMGKNLQDAKKQMKILLSSELKKTSFNAILIKEESNYFHYEFKTKIGKFIDDVEFLFDDKTEQIHFRSASRKGWSDLGKNRRRMKKIRRKYERLKI